MNTRRLITVLAHVGPALVLPGWLLGALPVGSARAARAPQDGLTPPPITLPAGARSSDMSRCDVEVAREEESYEFV